MFPLFRADGKPAVGLTLVQNEAIAAFMRKLADGEYVLEATRCLCGDERTPDDVVITEKDRYGLPIPSIICARCGLVRSALVLDAASNLAFYASEYRSLYGGSKTATDDFFQDQAARGRTFRDLARAVLPDEQFRTVLEVGCGAGGVLFPFHEAGAHCIGCDYDENYLAYGRAKGLDLRHGDYRELVPDRSVDLAVLSHVLEHFLDPIGELNALLAKVRPGGYLLIEVPGVLNLERVYFDLLGYFQNAHVYNFFAAYLETLLRALGVEVRYGSEHCQFIVRRPEHWEPRPVEHLDVGGLRAYPGKIRRYFIAASWRKRLGVNPHRWKHGIRRLLVKWGVPIPVRKPRSA